MKNQWLYKISSVLMIVMLALAALPVTPVYAAAITSTAAGGNWNATTTWVGGVVPTALDTVTIANGATVTVTANAAATSITFISAGANTNLNINPGITLAVSGAITIPRATGAAVNTLAVGAGILNAGSIAFTNGGNQVRHQLTISTGTVTVTGNVVGSAGNTSGTISFSGAGTLRLGGTFFNAADGTLITVAGSTVEYNAAAVQTAGNFTYSNLTLSGSGAKTITGVTVNNNLTLSGTATASTPGNMTIGGNLNVGSGTIFTVAANNTLTVTGTISVSGTLTLAGTGAKTFTGNVTVNNGGTWNETGVAAIGFAGNLQNDGTFTVNSGVHTFSGTAKTISGTNTVVIPNLTISGTTTNNGTLTVSTALAGASTLTNGATGTLNYGGAGAIAPTLIATAVGNTVNYIGAGAQTVKATTYSNLKLSGSGAKAMAAGTSVGGNMDITGALANITNLLIINVNSLSLGGVGQVAGSWGSNSSPATNKTNVYFSPTTGMLNVATNTVPNTPPTGGNGTVTTNEDTLYTFTVANFTTLTTPAYADAENNAFAGIQVTSLETAGTLQCGGVDVPLNSTCANVNTLTFLPAFNANGSPYATFGFKVFDGTAYSVGSYTMTVNVTAVNDAPAGTDKTITINEDAVYLLSAIDFGFTDPDAGDTMSAVRIDSVPVVGSLMLGPVSIVTGDVITLPNIGSLVLTPVTNANGAPYATITFSVRDTGGLAYTLNPNTFTFNVTAVNDLPSFTKGADQTVLEDAGAQTVAGWATAISAGPVNESAQTLTFNVTGNTNAGLFSVAPAINSTTGGLTYTPAANANGSATITITLSDNGGVANGGVDTSAAQTFVINVTAVNDAPSFTKGTDETVLENAGAQTVAGWATAISDGDPELTQTLTFNVTGNTNASLFSAAPAIDATTGNLTYTPAANANGSATITITLSDNGSNTSPDVNASTAQTFVINVTTVNDAPSFNKGTDQTVLEDAGAQTIVGWATAISAGPADESGQILTFNFTGNTNAGLFSTGPAIDATTGNLTYTPAANANGSATITITLSDNGSNTPPSVNTSAAQTFVINITAVNDPPSFTSSPVTSATQGSAYTYNITVADPDGDPLTITGSTVPLWLTFTDNANGTATLSGTPANTDVGSHSIILRATDGVISVPVEQAFTIIVDNLNDAPTFTSAPVTSVGESTPYTYNIVTADLDAGDTLVISATTLPSWLTLIDNGNRTATLSGTPSSSQVGVHSVVLEVTDGKLTASQSFEISVGNSAPKIATNGINSLADTGDGVLAESEVVSVGITKLLVTFNQDVYNPAGDTDAGDVTNPANYLLVRDNGDGIFQTVSCALGVSPLDTALTIDSVAYSNGGGSGPFVSTLNINSGLPLSNGSYRLYVCGTTSISDIVDNTLKLAGDGTTPGTDFTRNFAIAIANNGNSNGNGGGNNNGTASLATSGLLIPVTGFAPGRVTVLPIQPADKAYSPVDEMRIEIPTLGINFPIVGSALKKNSWDLTWLQNSVAYLEGSAYPTLPGNTVLSAHVTDANNNLGPFSDIKGMQLGQKIYIHAYGQVYVYQVQQNRKLLPSNISAVFKHEEYDWVTLVTCEDFIAKTGLYKYRRMVRAVLISVIPEK